MSDLALTCPHCGSLIGVDANFCPRCGTDLRPEGAEAATPSIPDDSASLVTTPPQPLKDQSAPAKSPAGREEGLPKPAAQRPAKQDEPDKNDLFPVLSGLLEPMGVSGEWGNEILATADRRATGAVDADTLRRARYRMLQEPTLTALVQPLPPTHGVYRVRWLFGLLALLVLIPYFMPRGGLMQAPQQWNGAVEAYDIVNGIKDQNVLVVWAYDPATAGEMDSLVLPVLRQLIQQKAKLEVVSLLPGGVATAQRLLSKATATHGDVAQNQAQEDAKVASLHFVPGGVAALPLVASALCNGDGCVKNGLLDLASCVPTCSFALVVVVAAQAEDVQRWLEIVAPVTNTPVIAVTSAAADLSLRPYLLSNQLAGLVGGFDGASTYLAQSSRLLEDEEWPERWHSLYGLRWGHFALLLVIFLGNLVAVGTTREEQ